MKILLLLFVILLTSCSHWNEKPLVQIKEVKYGPSDIEACREYQKTVLDRAYTVVSSPKGTDVIFTKDIKLARFYLSKFDVNLGLTELKSNAVQNILNKCDADLIKKFDQTYKELAQCVPLFSELNYFQALSVAIKKNSWPVDLKLEGKKIALDYVKHFSQGSYPLLNRLVALSVLDELSVNEIVNKELHSDIKNVMKNAQDYVESLRRKMNQDKNFSCESLVIIRDELGYSDQVAVKIKEFLRRI